MTALSKSFILSILLTLFLLCLAPDADASGLDSVRYDVSIHSTFSAGKNTPFWLVSNLQGLGSIEKNNGYLRASAFKSIEKDKKFSWGAGVDLIGGWNMTAPFSIHQLYGELKYRSLGLIVGSKEIWGEYNNPKLSSGNLLFSGNAMPIPQIRAGIFDYTPFWGTNGWFSVKGYISYGMFTDSNWQESWAAPGTKRTRDVLFHSKGMWLRGGNPSKFPLTAEVGIEMATQFGGTAYRDGKVVKMGHSLKDFIRAFFPTRTARDTFNGEQMSVLGNMVGAYNIALSWTPLADWSIKGYFEHYFEDHSQMTFEYGWKDALWGIEVELPKNPYVSTIVAEYLYSKDQTGPVNNDVNTGIPEQVSGRDNYYNHSVYTGWQHWGMGIGNPMMLSPVYNDNHMIYFMNTRVIGYHLGIAGEPTSELSYRLLLSYSRNWGTYNHPLPEVENSYNGLLEVSWQPRGLKGWYGTAGVAADAGGLLGKSIGLSLTIGKTGLFDFNKKRKKR